MQTDVVIAGGGPTGLMLAAELALHGTRSVVLDPLPGPNPQRRANSVGGMAVRLLDNRGLYEQLSADDGRPARSPGGSFAAMTMSLTDTPGAPTHLLVVSQPRLAATLAKRADHLGADLRWGHRVHSFTQSDDDVRIDVDGPTGRYQINAQYLVGADGGRSAIRKSAGIDFAGMSSNDALMRIGYGLTWPDKWTGPDGSVTVPGHGRLAPFNRTQTGLMLWTRLPTLTFVAVLELSPTPDDTRSSHDHPGYGESLTKAELEESLLRAFGVQVELQPVGDVELRQYAGINSRMAQHYRRGRILLAGDAAHVHSPIGGPGLNLCLQDAANLGFKLAGVVQGRASDSLLDTYEHERRLAGERVMMHSRAQFALLRPGLEITAVRQVFGEMLDHAPVRQHLANTLAGTTVRYPTVTDDHPATGYWVPDLTVTTAAGGVRRIAEFCRDGRPLLLDLTPDAALAASLDVGPGVNVVVGTAIEDTGFTAALVRPDGYVAWASSDPEPEVGALHAALVRWFGTPVISR